MKNAEFDKILEARLWKIKDTLSSKAKEYATDGDRLHNFKASARLNGETVPEALWGMATKHLVSVLDMVKGRTAPTEAMVNEKVGDMINYLILLEAVFADGQAEINAQRCREKMEEIARRPKPIRSPPPMGVSADDAVEMMMKSFNEKADRDIAALPDAQECLSDEHAPAMITDHEWGGMMSKLERGDSR